MLFVSPKKPTAILIYLFNLVLFDEFHDLRRGLIQILRRVHGQARLRNDLAALLRVRTGQTHHQRHAQRNLRARVHDALRDRIALHNAAEDVHEDALNLRVALNDLDGGRDLVGLGTAADVEEVRGAAAVQRDDVHRRHREPGAVDETADVAVEPDVVEVPLGGGDFARVLLVEVLVLPDLLLAVLGVVVEGDLRVDAHVTAVLRGHKRVDLDHCGVVRAGEVVQTDELLCGGLGQSELAGELHGLLLCEALLDADGHLDDLLGGLLRDGLDVHAALRRRHHDGALRRAVEQKGDVVLLLDLGEDLRHVQLRDLHARGAGLLRHERVAEHLASLRHGVGRVGAHVDAALEARREGALAAATGEDLGLDDLLRCVDLAARGLDLLNGLAHVAHLDVAAGGPEELLCAVLMDVEAASELGGRGNGNGSEATHLFEW
eukprot:PhM_4_TR12668/c0_g1_i1/m.74664